MGHSAYQIQSSLFPLVFSSLPSGVPCRCYHFSWRGHPMIYKILLLTSLLPIGVCIGSTFLGRAIDRLVVVIACRMYARFLGLSVPADPQIVLELHCTSWVTRQRLFVNSRTPCGAEDTNRVRSHRSKGLATVSAMCLPWAFSYLGCGSNIKCSCRCSPALPYGFPVQHQS